MVAQLFIGTHASALLRAEALDAGATPPEAPHLDLDVAPEDLDELGQIVARVVRFGSGDTEAMEVDLEHESLVELPEFWCEALTELAGSEEPDAVDDVAQAWAQAEGMAHATGLGELVQRIADLASRATDSGDAVYLWVG